LKRVVAWTDGACSGNPGPGGYGVVLTWNGHRKELAALESLSEPCEITIHSDSQYVVNAINEGWARKWQANRWMRNKKERALNPDLWQRLLALLPKHKVKLEWVRGHAGNEENERADELAVGALRGPDLAVDEHYDGAR